MGAKDLVRWVHMASFDIHLLLCCTLRYLDRQTYDLCIVSRGRMFRICDILWLVWCPALPTTFLLQVNYSELHAISLHQISSSLCSGRTDVITACKPAVDIWKYFLFASFVSGFLPSQWSTLCIHWVWRTSSSSARQKLIALAVITFWPLSQMAANLTQFVCLHLSGHTLMCTLIYCQKKMHCGGRKRPAHMVLYCI